MCVYFLFLPGGGGGGDFLFFGGGGGGVFFGEAWLALLVKEDDCDEAEEDE